MERIPDDEVLAQHSRIKHANMLWSVNASTAIEGNTLWIDDIRNIFLGRTIHNSYQVQEVRGAIKAYEKRKEYDPYSTDDMLTAHHDMMSMLVEEDGKFRTCGVGVFKGNVPVHIAPDFKEVPGLVEDLMEWALTADHHPLIKSSIYHYLFEHIHPFRDGNGRMGRLWQSLILMRWEPIFEWMPIETKILSEQKNYYSALQSSDPENVTPFVSFMLRAIRNAVSEFVDEMSDLPQLSEDEARIINTMSIHEVFDVGKLAEKLDINEETVKRCISSLEKKRLIIRHDMGTRYKK